MSDYIVLSPIEPPEKCYLFEVLLWRAFGRYPEMAYGEGSDEDWRFDSDARSRWDAPILNGAELSEGECKFAGIPNDPRMEALLTDRPLLGAEFYIDLKEKVDWESESNKTKLAEFELEIEDAKLVDEEWATWLPVYEEYLDQYQNEITLDLRRGDWTLYGSELPTQDRKKAEQVLENKEIWLDDLPVVPIPPEHWVSKDIDWDESALYGRQKSYVWIHANTDEMINQYKPAELIRGKELLSLGDNFAMTSATANGASTRRSKRGRPSFPWEEFHVEVARMFRDGEMPDKKEAAIATLQEWFLKNTGKSASRTIVGEKLKPYFDALLKKDRKS